MEITIVTARPAVWVAAAAVLWTSVSIADGPGQELRVRPVQPGATLATPDIKEQLREIGVALTPEQEAQHNRAIESRIRDGHLDASSSEPRARYIEKRMAERIAMVKASGKPMSPESLGFYDLQQTPLNSVQGLPFQPTPLPAQYIFPGSKGFAMRAGQAAKQFYTRTRFGTLIIDQINDTTAQLFAPNIQIGGFPASLVYIRHKAGQWATVIYAPKGDRMWIVEADRKLEGKDRDEFVRMVSSLAR